MQPSSDPHLNFSIDLSWFFSPPGTGSSPPIRLLLRKYCLSSPCILRREGNSGNKPERPTSSSLCGPALKGRHSTQFSLHLGKLRLRAAPCFGHPTQAWRLRLSLFIELQVEMCGFGGASPSQTLPPWATIAPSAEEWGVVRGLGHWGGVSKVPAGLVGPRIKHGEHGRQRGGGLPRPWRFGVGGFCTRSSSTGVPAMAPKNRWVPQD